MTKYIMFLKKLFSFATLTLLVALTLSSIAAWYSVLGLTAIFAAAVVPIMIMGGSLEFAKVVTTVWLHRYWNRAGWKLKLYLVPAVIMLAFLTSMGIFGFLSKAHSDQSLVSGDVQAKVAVYDQKIKPAKDNIDSDRKALQQMDAAVDQVMGRSTDVKGAQQSTNIRKSQSKERARLNKEIEDNQTIISNLNDEAAPIRAQVRKVEAEVGPIKYIAALIYGDNPDNNLLERAVRWVIIVIVFVFDPLALTLVLAAQSSYEWLDEDLKKEEEEKLQPKEVEPEDFEPEEIHDKCGTPECCGKCDTAVDAEFIARLDAVKPKKIAHEVSIDAPSDTIETDPPVEESVEQLEQIEETVTEIVIPEELEIQTEGVTIHEMEHGYVQVDGKQMHKSAFLGMDPRLLASPNDEKNGPGFGSIFPQFAAKGDVFVRVDTLPNRVYKFDGVRWIEINKDLSDSYLYDEEYLKHLVAKIESGEYDVELLSDNERSEIEDYLQRTTKTDK
jgi:hypothetical protein